MVGVKKVVPLACIPRLMPHHQFGGSTSFGGKVEGFCLVPVLQYKMNTEIYNIDGLSTRLWLEIELPKSYAKPVNVSDCVSTSGTWFHKRLSDRSSNSMESSPYCNSVIGQKIAASFARAIIFNFVFLNENCYISIYILIQISLNLFPLLPPSDMFQGC